jgi:hypothetical protein
MDKPEALRLADWCEAHSSGVYRPSAEAAAELRRLVAENARLHQINQSHEMKLSVRGYEIQIADLKTVNQELLEAMKDLTTAQDLNAYGMALHNARAAIAKAEGEKT